MSGVEVWMTRPTVPCAVSRRLVDAAVGEAAARSVPVTVVIVDESGVLKERCRMNGAPLVSVQTAMNKAYAATAIGMAPDEFYAAIEADAAAVASFAARPGMAPIAGVGHEFGEGHLANGGWRHGRNPGEQRAATGAARRGDRHQRRAGAA